MDYQDIVQQLTEMSGLSAAKEQAETAPQKALGVSVSRRYAK
jgi:hypothetical protein